jgi:hypothetical protein
VGVTGVAAPHGTNQKSFISCPSVNSVVWRRQLARDRRRIYQGVEVSDFTSSRPKVSIENATYEVTADWTPMLRRHERSYAAMTYIEIESLLQNKSRREF